MLSLKRTVAKACRMMTAAGLPGKRAAEVPVRWAKPGEMGRNIGGLCERTSLEPFVLIRPRLGEFLLETVVHELVHATDDRLLSEHMSWSLLATEAWPRLVGRFVSPWEVRAYYWSLFLTGRHCSNWRLLSPTEAGFQHSPEVVAGCTEPVWSLHSLAIEGWVPDLPVRQSSLKTLALGRLPDHWEFDGRRIGIGERTVMRVRGLEQLFQLADKILAA
jgi:hypothetical protein